MGYFLTQTSSFPESIIRLMIFLALSFKASWLRPINALRPYFASKYAHLDPCLLINLIRNRSSSSDHGILCFRLTGSLRICRTGEEGGDGALTSSSSALSGGSTESLGTGRYFLIVFVSASYPPGTSLAALMSFLIPFFT